MWLLLSIKMFLIVLRPEINISHPLSPNNLLFFLLLLISRCTFQVKWMNRSDQHSFDWGTLRCYVCLQPFSKQRNHRPNINVDWWITGTETSTFSQPSSPLPSKDSNRTAVLNVWDNNGTHHKVFRSSNKIIIQYVDDRNEFEVFFFLYFVFVCLVFDGWNVLHA